jgi:hypothetical protein
MGCLITVEYSLVNNAPKNSNMGNVSQVESILKFRQPQQTQRPYYYKGLYLLYQLRRAKWSLLRLLLVWKATFPSGNTLNIV